MKTSSILALSLLTACGSSTTSDGGGGDGGAGGSAEPTERLVFVTESTRTGDVGGPTGADAICANEAAAAGIAGEFKAWLSVSETPVGDRLTQSTLPYVLPNGTRIADDWDDLVDGSIQAPINVDATGQARGGDVWTGTLSDGQTFGAGDCMGFRSEASNIVSRCGSTAFDDARWTDAQTPSCNTPLRLFCFQQ